MHTYITCISHHFWAGTLNYIYTDKKGWVRVSKSIPITLYYLLVCSCRCDNFKLKLVILPHEWGTSLLLNTEPAVHDQGHSPIGSNSKVVQPFIIDSYWILATV